MGVGCEGGYQMNRLPGVILFLISTTADTVLIDRGGGLIDYDVLAVTCLPVANLGKAISSSPDEWGVV